MSITYDTMVHVVGPADKVALFKEKALGLPAGAHSTGVELQKDTPTHMTFAESTYNNEKGEKHALPALALLGLAEPMAVAGVTVRTVLCCNTTSALEVVIENNKIASSRQLVLDTNSRTVNEEEPPVVVRSQIGKVDAWAKAYAQVFAEAAVN